MSNLAIGVVDLRDAGGPSAGGCLADWGFTWIGSSYRRQLALGGDQSGISAGQVLEGTISTG